MNNFLVINDWQATTHSEILNKEKDNGRFSLLKTENFASYVSEFDKLNESVQTNH